MADKKISELPASSALDTDDLLAVVEDGATVKATVQDLLDLVPSSGGLTVINAVTDYGATGDGATNDRTAIQDALDAAAVTGGTVYLPAGTYLIKRPLFIDSNVTLQGAGRGVTTITKPATVKSVLTANASAAATTVTVTSSTGFVVGEAIHISDTTSFEWLATQGVITNVAGNVITFDNDEGLGHTGLDGEVQTARTATAYTTFPLLRNVEAATNVQVRDLTLDHNKNASDPQPTSSSVNGVADFTVATIHWVEAYRAVVDNVEMLDAPCDAYSDQGNDGHGLTINDAAIKTTNNTIRNSRIRDAARHGVHTGTCISGSQVLGNEITGCGWYGYFYCAYSTNSVASGNVVDGCGYGFAGLDSRDHDNTIVGNVIKNTTVWGIEASNGGAGGTEPPSLVVTGNIVFGGAGSRPITCDLPDTVITGNRFTMGTATDNGIVITAAADRTIVSNNVIRQPTAVGGSIGIDLTGCDDVRVVGNSISGMANGIRFNGATRAVCVANSVAATTARDYWLNGTASADCKINDNQGTRAVAYDEDTAPTRLVYNGLGSNGSSDPASAGDWNAVTGKRWNGTIVRWNSGSGEKVSIYFMGVGWTALN